MPLWVKSVEDLKIAPTEKVIPWLEKPKNIGAALRKVCQELKLQILDQSFDQPTLDEEHLLNSNGHYAEEQSCFIRQIYLIGDDMPFTYGRVVVPKHTYLQCIAAFNALGNKLIGETLLYNNPKTTRSSFEYAAISRAQALYGFATKQLPNTSSKPATLWARRSIFHIEGIHPVLISEVLLSEIPGYVD